ncbi:lactonase family protein [Lachnoclostridium pacaense]|uniref:lactonase family protein n=1 Tax=Enterocloster hominis (ex Hitch et al. 2024) TaxID=1917870 RepID=UPI001D109CAC|nr:lactonase family protein [Lachnoclostridium pacaense]MCC2875460.1 lactonase family protein [Lachnoclostridium pacaense]
MKTCLWVGTYTCDVESGERRGTDGQGIYAFEFDDETQRARLCSIYEGCRNPSFLAVSGNMLYAVSEMAEGGCVTALRYDAGQGRFTYVNEMPIPGSAACHVLIWKEKNCLVITNYLSGSMVNHALLPDGSIGARNGFFQYEGRGEDPVRQEGPHAHSSILSPDGKTLFVADLGTDRLHHYRWDEASQGPVPCETCPETYVGPGEGPRHMCFSPDGRYLYLVTELKGNVFCYQYNSEDGHLTFVQKIPSLPASYTGFNLAADIHMSSDGRYLYVSERGADIISVFQVDRETGLLGTCRFQLCGGKSPRNFCLSPCGRYIVAANQDSGNLVIFRRNAQDGLLGEVVEEIRIPSPVCVRMADRDSLP